jgi:hypothetical protein
MRNNDYTCANYSIINFVNISTMKTCKNFKNVSLKKGLQFLAAGAFIALCTFNVILGLSDYDKTSIVSLTKEALASESSGSEVAVCLQIHVQVTGKKETNTSDYCYRDAQGIDICEGRIVQCTSTGATSISRCNETSCRSVTGCFIGPKQ